MSFVVNISGLLTKFHKQSIQPPYQHMQANVDAAQSLLAALSGHLPPQNDLTKLKADIATLINTAQADLSRAPFDSGVQQRLKALQDLQVIVQSQQLPPDAIAAIKTQVASLSSVPRPAIRSPVMQPKPVEYPSWQPRQDVQIPNNLASFLNGYVHPPPSSSTQASSVPPTGPPSFAPGSLEALLSGTVNRHNASNSLPRQVLSDQAVPNASQAQSLIDAVRAAGLAAPFNQPNHSHLQSHLQHPPASNSAQSATDLLASLANLPNLNNLLSTVAMNPHQPDNALRPPRPRLALSQANLKG